MEEPWTRVMPKLLSEQCVYIDNALTRLTTSYRTTMLESHRTESALVAEYLIENADEVLDLKARARALSPNETEMWLKIIRQRITSIVNMRRPR
jgi:hypothetical protein